MHVILWLRVPLALFSFSVRVGVAGIFAVCLALLTVIYSIGIAVGASSSHPLSRWFTVFYHFAALSLLWRKAVQVDTGKHDEIVTFYKFVWKLFQLQYVVLPLVR